MAEFSLIEKYCTGLGHAQDETRLAVGDDAAVLTVPVGQELLISVDTMVESVHFLPGTEPAKLAHKILAVNLSDIAAMGGTPKWATLAMTLPHEDETWFAAFAAGLDHMAKQHQLELIGGDLTSGPLSLTLQIMGLVDAGQALTRSGAQVGDGVYVSGTVGDAALALAGLQGRVALSSELESALLPMLECPQPQLALGQRLLGIASACIDISDGVIADLGHIGERSEVSLDVDLASLPLSAHYQAYLQDGGGLDLAAAGGDDYQLAFCVPVAQQGALETLRSEGFQITRIGDVTAQGDKTVRVHYAGREINADDLNGYQHFK